MRTITFYSGTFFGTKKKVCTSYAGTLWIIRKSRESVYTTQVALISFDLLKQFDKIILVAGAHKYELKLGINTWNDKELRVEYNLLKIVTEQFLAHL
jgi:hypothetical protein